MDQKLNTIMAQVFEYESNDEITIGVNYIKKMIDENPQLKIDLLYECSMLYFRNRMYYQALMGLIEVYKLIDSEEILNFIFEAYINPNQKTYNKNYEKNSELLKEYNYLFSDELGKYAKLNIKIVWKDEEKLIYFYNNCFVEKTIVIKRKEIKKTESLFINLIGLDEIKKLELALDIDYSYISPFKKSPMYLCYSEELFYILLCSDYDPMKEILKKNRIVFLVGSNTIKNYFCDIQVILPEKVYICVKDKKIVDAIIDAIKGIPAIANEFGDSDIVRINNYYLDKKDEIKNNIKSRKFKMLIITSLLTTAVQFHAKNLQCAAQKMDIETFFLTEKSNFHNISEMCIWKTIEDFRPDVILLMDHFRFECFSLILLENVVVLNWVQDQLPVIMDKSSPSKLVERDFILNHFITWQPFLEVGYSKDKLIDAPIPCNQDIYRPYILTDDEKAKYNTDICLVCHASDFTHCIEVFNKKINNSEIKELISNMCYAYYNVFKEEGIFFYTEEECQQYISAYSLKFHRLKLDELLLKQISYWLFWDINQRIYRQVLVDWLLEAGFTNIKLWGNGWLYEEKYKEYAMGTANNGEELSKILQASKIVIGNNFICTGAARIWETMLSGGFFLSTYVPREIDSVDIRTILNEDEYVMFRDKKDLIDKVSYYLKNEEERKFMAKKGRDRALEKMTFDVLMKRIVDELAKRL